MRPGSITAQLRHSAPRAFIPPSVVGAPCRPNKAGLPFRGQPATQAVQSLGRWLCVPVLRRVCPYRDRSRERAQLLPGSRLLSPHERVVRTFMRACMHYKPHGTARSIRIRTLRSLLGQYVRRRRQPGPSNPAGAAAPRLHPGRHPQVTGFSGSIDGFRGRGDHPEATRHPGVTGGHQQPPVQQPRPEAGVCSWYPRSRNGCEENASTRQGRQARVRLSKGGSGRTRAHSAGKPPGSTAGKRYGRGSRQR